ncbi:HemK2/MTQ2 family protein methyltransferase [Nocardia aurantiaca]|uniref:Methyltransferase n=1 Tax=Nocardia aurantiaca TaxID=2675850 RepID=A0A6I3L1P1_9NOCA|nr:HemK2/MTQ2 family protein methyltransferase [Nocardia aurantiaca]MTE15188.1 methyltransferase [Nocardia aurantiaca]
MMLIRTPGVYRPQADTRLLARAYTDARIPPHSRVVDVGTGTGALAIEAARHSRSVTAVDISRAALASAWLNCRLHGVNVELVHGDFRKALHGRTFDVMVSNPPYVPSRSNNPPRGAARAWDAGIDGRSVIDSLCELAPEMLSDTGTLLMVQSALSGIDNTLTRLRAAGLKAAAVAQATIPFGPILRRRAAWLTDCERIQPGQCDEELVIIRADRPRQ